MPIQLNSVKGHLTGSNSQQSDNTLSGRTDTAKWSYQRDKSFYKSLKSN